MACPRAQSAAMTGGLAPGLQGRPYCVPVEQGKVREFARATKAADERFWSQPAPFLPPTFLIASAFWLEPGSSVLERGDLDWGRLLSGGSQFTFDGPPLRAGEELTAAQRVDEVYRKQGRRAGDMTFIVFTTTFTRPDGTVAARDRHTTILTRQPPVQPPGQAAAGPGASAHPDFAPQPGPGPSRPAAIPGGPARLRPGDPLPSLVDAPVSVTDIVRYQGASGDMNPIHHDPDVARAAGFPGVFSVGMLHAGILGSYLADLFCAERVRQFGVQFREQVWPGDVLTYSGEVISRRPGADGATVELGLDLTARRHRGGEHLRAVATVLVAPR
jgi:acyl dehydratase